MSYIKHDSTHDYDIIGGVCSTSIPDTDLPDGSKDKFAKIVVNIPEITEILGEDMTCTNPVQLAQSSKINIWSLNKPFHWKDNNGIVFDYDLTENAIGQDSYRNWIDDIDEGEVLRYVGTKLPVQDSIVNHMKTYSPTFGDPPSSGDPIYLGDWRKYVHCNSTPYYRGGYDHPTTPFYIEQFSMEGTYSAGYNVWAWLSWNDYSAENFSSASGFHPEVHGGEEVTDPLGFKYFPEAGLLGIQRLFELISSYNYRSYLVMWLGSGPGYEGTSSRRTKDLLMVIKIKQIDADTDTKAYEELEGAVDILSGKAVSEGVSEGSFCNDETVRMGVGLCIHIGNSQCIVPVVDSQTTDFHFVTSSGEGASDKRAGITSCYIYFRVKQSGNYYYWDIEDSSLEGFYLTYQQKNMAITTPTEITFWFGYGGAGDNEVNPIKFKITVNPDTKSTYNQTFTTADIDGWNSDPAQSSTALLIGSSVGTGARDATYSFSIPYCASNRDSYPTTSAIPHSDSITLYGSTSWEVEFSQF